MKDHETIYLQPICNKVFCPGNNADEGRHWCEDDIGACEECGKDMTEYVRADIAAGES